MPVAGMLIAAQTGPKTAEAAMVSDAAARFGNTVNPMLQQLFGAWHPGSAGQVAGPAASAGPAPLHQVMAPDNSASVGIPNGWTFKGSEGTMIVNGPNSEVVGLNYTRLASNPVAQRTGMPAATQGKILYPANVDPVKGFPGLFQAFWRVNGGNPTLQVTNAQQVPGPNGQRCVHATGHAVLGGPAGAASQMPEMEALLCTTAPGPMGNYMVSLSMSLIPANLADKERATVGAILSSFQVNQAVVARQANAMAAPAIAQIHAIGQAATARYNATQASNQQQWAGFDQQESNISRQGQGFSNYLLDQSVVQTNNVGGTGAVSHTTMWNTQANALVQSNPNKYEFVPEQNYWAGTDFQP
jgi:hypothetical protein